MDTTTDPRAVAAAYFRAWKDLHTTVAPPAPTANRQHIEDARITAIGIAFDPRALTGGR